MKIHPLIELSNDREVKQAKGFRKAAADLDGPALEPLYDQERGSAPKRHEIDRKYFERHTGRLPKQRQNGKDGEHLSLALLDHCRESGQPLQLAGGETLQPLDYSLPLATAAPDKERGDEDPNKGVGKVDLLGLTADDRLSVVVVKYLPPEATRGGTGDTPLRALLDGLAKTAMVDANSAPLRAEVLELTGRTVSEEAPQLVLLGAARYWELCRKREAQKGAGWIRELERLAREVGEHIGVEVVFLGLELEGDPGWEYRDDAPHLTAPPKIAAAWEPGAGKLKPKPKPRSDPANQIVEADLSREPKAYDLHASYEAGDRILHTKLGTGVVQGLAGRGKIHVLFPEDRKSVLVHERP